MPYSKNTPTSPLQRKILDNYYSNGFDALKAYCDAKDIPLYKDNKKKRSAYACVSATKKNNPEYVAKLEEKNDKKYCKMRDKLVDQLEGVATTYQQMVTLALQDELSEEDTAKFNRLKSIMSTRDMNKAIEVIGRLTGSFEPDKTEITNTFKVEWGAAPQIQETTKPVLDVDYEDVEEDVDEDE